MVTIGSVLFFFLKKKKHYTVGWKCKFRSYKFLCVECLQLFAPPTNGTTEPRVVVPYSGVQDTLVKLFDACLTDVKNCSNPNGELTEIMNIWNWECYFSFTRHSAISNTVLAEEFRSRVLQGYVGIPSSTVDDFLKTAFNSSGALAQPTRPIPMVPNQGKVFICVRNNSFF